MRTIYFPVSNHELDAVPFDQYLERIGVDGSGHFYLDGKPIERYLTGSIEVADDATDEQVRQALEAKAAEMRASK